MSAKKSSLGLKKIEIADVTAVGLPSSWTELEAVKIGTAVFAETEPSTEDVRIEQKSGIYRSITTEDGVTTLEFELYDVSPANIALLKGGTATTATTLKGSSWKKGSETIDISKAVRATTLDDYVLIIPNGKVIATVNWMLSKSELATVRVKITAQEPLDSTLGEWEMEAPDKTA